MHMFRKFKVGSTDAAGDGQRSASPTAPTKLQDDAGGERSLSAPSQERSILRSGLGDQQDKQASNVFGGSLVSSSQPHSIASRRTAREKETDDPLGLNLIHGTSDCDADIIFVHGLGGSLRKTWSWERNPDMFWPAWIRHEEGLSQLRVFSYGYNANFWDSENPLSILDFAKGLLVRMNTYGYGSSEEIGSRPIVFVAHSMGGLVVKKALVIGKHDPHFSGMLARVHGILFFSTPHKGTPHARTLNRFLSTMVGTSTKVYVSELENSSTSIEDISEQFRVICSNWQLVSLYETLPTKLLPGVKKMIVGKDSGILAYPQEVSAPVDADHHTICKFSSRLDPSYILATNLLRQLTHGIRSKQFVEPTESSSGDMGQILRTILGIQGDIQEDIDNQLSRALHGSCQWFHQCENFKSWLDASDDTYRLLWVTGPPGTGKSVLAAKTVKHIQKAIRCQFHFFIGAQPIKRSTSYCLRALAFQLATAYPAFADRLIQLHRQSKFSAADQTLQVIWDTIFENIIFKMNFGSTLHWVLDGLDEADTPTLLLRHLIKMRPQTSIKLLFLSRPKRELTSLASSRLESIVIEPLSIQHTMPDIRGYIRSAVIEILPKDEALLQFVVEKVASRAEGSFLWTKLVLDSLWDNWHTQADIELALNNVPNDMQALYQRMMESVKSQPPRLQEIAFRVLAWGACSFRPLTIAELVAALKPEFDGFFNLGETAIQICGQFVRVHQGTISLIHGTARQFLLSWTDESASNGIGFKIDHDYLATVCLKYLSQDHWRRVFARASDYRSSIDSDRLESLYDEYPFLRYAMNFWAYHVSLARVNASEMVSNLRLFCNLHILLWIQAMALSSNLRGIPIAAQYLKKWLRRRRKVEFEPQNSEIASGCPSLDDTAFMGRWVTDLIRIVAKFGPNLAQSPSAIHSYIPPFCPTASIISRTYCQEETPLISVSGISMGKWDDNLARLSIGQDEIAAVIRCAGRYFMTLISHNGTVILWDMETCEELRRISHGEWVTHMEVNTSGTLAATAGRFTFRVWDTSTGKQLYSIPRNGQTRVVSLTFAKADTELVIGQDDCSVISHNLESSLETTLSAAQGQDTPGNCPRFLVLSPDHTKLAIGFRGRPVVIWELFMIPQPEPRSIIRAADRDFSENSEDVFNSPEVARWHPEGSSVYFLYQDATILAWNLIDEIQEEFGDTEAREMILNHEGTLLLTSNNSGSVRVWGLPKFNLVYRLDSAEFVRDLAFSPDGQRIYDVRGSVVNVWAPDVLVRVDEFELDEKSNDLDEPVVSEALNEPVFAEDMNSRGTITALVCDAEDEFFCCGRDDGTVSIYEMRHGQRVRKVSSHSKTVDVIALDWSSSRRFIASADDSGKVIAKRLRIKEDEQWAVYPLFELRVEEAVTQLLFSSSETLLLVATDTTDRLWDLQKKIEVCRTKRQSKRGMKWVNHPLDETLVISVEPAELHIYEWENLERMDEGEPGAAPAQEAPKDTAEEISSLALTRPVDSQGTVSTVIVPKSHQYLLCEILPGRGVRRSNLALGSRLDLVQAAGLTAANCKSVRRTTLEHLGPQVQHLLGTHRDRIVFLDHENWICTSTIGGDTKSIKRHYFLPRNWCTDMALPMMRVNGQGTVLCARNAEVAILRDRRGLL